MKDLLRNLVVVSCLLCTGGFATWLWLRPELPRAGSYSDGVERVSPRGLREELRSVLWSTPSRLEDLPTSSEVETDPFLDPGSGDLYFTLGGEGQDQDLYVARRDLDGRLAVEPLLAVNSSADERSPTFHDGHLYFSSDRPGGRGGFDLWRARLTARGFEEPENLGDGVNTGADETDPVFRPRSSELYFCSNADPAVGRDDYDVRFSRTDGRFFADSSALGRLSSPFDERHPTFTADGNALVFASDRSEGKGGFDLYRAFFDQVDFDHAEALAALNSPADEWAPSFADGGYHLLFSSDRSASGDHDLYEARSRELYALPREGVSLLDLTILFLLLLLAILAWLGKRWQALDILYKCLLISVLLHLLILWLTRRVDIVVEQQPAEEGRQVYEVQLSQLLEELSTLEDREREDAVESPERSAVESSLDRRSAELAPSEARAKEDALTESRPTSEPSAAPSRRAADHSPARAESSVQVALENQREEFERFTGAAPSVEVATSAAEAQPQAMRTEPQRESPALAADTSATAREASPALSRSAAEPGSAPSRVSHAVSRTPSIAEGPRMAVELPDDRVDLDRTASPSTQVDVSSVVDAASSQHEAHTQPLERGAPPALRSDASEVRARADAPIALAARSEVPSAPAARTPRESLTPRAVALSADPVRTEQPSDRVAAAAEASAPAGAASLAAGPSTTAVERETSTTLPQRQGSALAEVASRHDPRADASDSASLQRPREIAAAPGRRARETIDRTNRSVDSLLPRLENPSDTPATEASSEASSALAAGAGIDARSFREQGSSSEPATRVTRARTEIGRAPERSASGGPASLARGASGPSPNRAARQDVALAGPRGVERSLEPVALAVPEAARSGAPDSATTSSAPTGLDLGPQRFSRPGGAAGGAIAAGPTRSTPLLADAIGNAGPAPLAPLARAADPPTRPKAAPEKREATAPTRLAQLYQKRQGSAKEQALREGGGSAETERAVLAGLRYLASVQRGDGSFGDRNDRTDRQKYRDVRYGKTGLALLAFLGANHTHRSGTEFSNTVQAAVDWLLQSQDRRSGHFGPSDGYGHGIATYALVECYALTQDRTLINPLIRAIRHIEEMQIRDSRDPDLIGGWAYYYPEGRGDDPYPRTSLSSWQAMALESATVANLPVADDSLELARRYFLGTFDPRYGYYRYNHNPEWLNNASGYRTLPASTPASMFVLSLLGAEEHPSLESGARYVMERAPEGWFYRSDDAFARDGVGNLYFWYYGTLAMYLRGGADWRVWNAAMKKTLLEGQRRDGSWDPISTYAREYAGDDAGERTYSTAMCVLTLEVYYRYFTPQLERAGGGGAPR